jgi:hypothetical protein
VSKEALQERSKPTHPPLSSERKVLGAGFLYGSHSQASSRTNDQLSLAAMEVISSASTSVHSRDMFFPYDEGEVHRDWKGPSRFTVLYDYKTQTISGVPLWLALALHLGRTNQRSYRSEICSPPLERTTSSGRIGVHSSHSKLHDEDARLPPQEAPQDLYKAALPSLS